ncbi:hypothetical protein DIPPA_34450 [Diplonema papillatum]|nr:hypothetical protein DIPPA_34450 [Diplonema papillatum]
MQGFTFPVAQGQEQRRSSLSSNGSSSVGSLKLPGGSPVAVGGCAAATPPLTIPSTPACKATVLVYCKRPACGQVLALLKAAGAAGIRTKYVAEKAANSGAAASPTGCHTGPMFPSSPTSQAGASASSRGFLAVESTLSLDQAVAALKSLSVAVRAAATFRIPPEVNPRCRLHIAAYVLNEPAGVKNLKKPFVVHVFQALGVDADSLRKIRVQRSRHRGVYDIQAEFGTPELSVAALRELQCGHAFVPIADSDAAELEVVVSGEFSDRCGTLKVERETTDGVMSGDPEWYETGMGHLYTNGRWKDWTPSAATCFALADQPPKLMDVELSDLVDDILFNTEEEQTPVTPNSSVKFMGSTNASSSVNSLSTRSMPPALVIPRRASLEGTPCFPDARPSNTFAAMTPVAACGSPTFIHSRRASDCTTVGPYSPSACDADRIDRAGRMSITSSQASPPLSPERFMHSNPSKSSASSCSSGSADCSLQSIGQVPLIPAKINAPFVVCQQQQQQQHVEAQPFRVAQSQFTCMRYPEVVSPPHHHHHHQQQQHGYPSPAAAGGFNAVQRQLEALSMQRQLLAAKQDALALQQHQLLQLSAIQADAAPAPRWH